MDPQTVFCHNPACPARGQVGKGNISVHSQKDRRYICHECNSTFAETIRRDLVDLVRKNLLLKIGEKRATYYIFK